MMPSRPSGACLVRWQVLAICAAFNIYGIAVYFLLTRQLWTPFTYETLRAEIAQWTQADTA